MKNANESREVSVILLAADGELKGSGIDITQFLNSGWEIWKRYKDINPSFELTALIRKGSSDVSN
ncbi:MAG: hypothetical protein H7235_06670 [Bdellovibrionaceae bacterium]|nr:hypothetical protein [Pseudobdellovibrionaceae bacterium]